MSERRTVTLEDVAIEAGVSVSTASRTLNGAPGRVSAGTQERVHAVARRLGYATNLAAQAVARGRSRSIGLIVGDVPEDYQNPVVAGVFRSAGLREMLVTTAVTSVRDVERSRATVRRLRGLRPSVILYIGTETPDSPGMAELIAELAHAESEGTRVVIIGVRGTPFDSVVVDDVKAGRDMAAVLAGLGYRDVMVLAGSGLGKLSVDRTDGFVAGMREAGVHLTPDRVLWQEFSHDGGYRAAGEALGRHPVPDAVFCVNDAMAIGACVRLREQGLRIGRDIGVAGCDDIPALRDIDPPLTTVHLPWIEAAEHALVLAEDETSTGRTVVLEGHAVVRSSTPGRGPASA